MQYPNPWYTWQGSLSNFLLALLEIGVPIETSLVGAFDKEEIGRGSRRDVDLPLHRDGVYSQALADVQGGFYVEKPGVDLVALYCLRGSTKGRCETILLLDGYRDDLSIPIELKEGEGLVFDNNKVLHGRHGPVGERILMRVWLKKNQ